MNDSVRKVIDRLRSESDGAVSDTPPDLVDDNRLIVFDGTPLRIGDLASRPLDRKIGDGSEGGGKIFKVRLARSRALYDANALVTQRYGQRGYDTAPMPAETDRQLFTFVAYSQGVVVGTVAIRMDEPGTSGLGADDLYAAELTTLRNAGARICEFTRLAVDTETSSKPILAALFHTAYLFAFRVCQYHCAVIEVNPRHVVFYRRALSFAIIGPERLNRRVNAPAVLLCVTFDAICEGLEKFAGKPELAAKTHTLFPYGFPPDEEAGVLNRLRSLRSADLV